MLAGRSFTVSESSSSNAPNIKLNDLLAFTNKSERDIFRAKTITEDDHE